MQLSEYTFIPDSLAVDESKVPRSDRGNRGERALWAAVVETALEDIVDPPTHIDGRRVPPRDIKRRRREAWEFLQGDWGEQVCGWLGLDAKVLAEGIARRVAVEIGFVRLVRA